MSFPTAAGRGRFVLVVAALVHVGLFVGTVHFRTRITECSPLLLTGEGLVIGSDGVGYYAWLRSLLVDGDWQFDNEFDQHNPLNSAVPSARTPDGRRLNQWSVGPALVWSVAVAPAHAVLVATDGFGWWPTHGYSLPYQLLVGATTLALSLLTLVLTAKICQRFVAPQPAALASAVVTLGTPLVHYGAVEPSMAHGLAATALAGYVWFWLRGFGSLGAGRWFALGALLGVTALMRWQLATYVLLPAGELVWCAVRQREWRRAVACVGAAAVGTLVAFSPQLIAWKITCGRWLANPHPLVCDWLSPDATAVFASTDRGLFYWTPVTLIAFGGLVRLALRGGSFADGLRVRLVLTGFLAQAYLMSVAQGNGVSLGASFGNRFLSESCVPLAIGLAFVLDRRSAVVRGALGAVCGALVIWNLVLIAAYVFLVVPPGEGANPAALVEAGREIITRPWLGEGWSANRWQTFRRRLLAHDTIVLNAWRVLACLAGASIWLTAVGRRGEEVALPEQECDPAGPPVETARAA